MYSWKTIRIACAVLLTLPLIHLAYLLLRETLTTLEPSPTVWQKEVDAYRRQDEQTVLPRDPVVVIGGRGVALWERLEAATAPKPVLVRALGSATVNDLIHYHERLVAFYQPSAVVLLPGNSEFHMRDDKTADELVAAIQALAALEENHEGTYLLYVYAPIKTPRFPEDHGKIDEVARQLRDWAQTRPDLRLLDPNPLLATHDGRPDPGLFRTSGIQLNRGGYLRLDLLLREQLKADFPQEYTVSAWR